MRRQADLARAAQEDAQRRLRRFLGGFLGGLPFGLPARRHVGCLPRSDLAIGLVILGLCIGLLIGLAQVILKEAWVKVEGASGPAAK